MNTHITLHSLSSETGVPLKTLEYICKKHDWKISPKTPLNDEQEQKIKSEKSFQKYLSGEPKVAKEKTEKPKEPVKPVTKTRFKFPKITRRNGIDFLAGGLVIGHGFLLWFDCWELWGKAGAIGGIFGVALIVLSFMLATDSNLNRTSSYALWFMFILDCAAWKVHFDTFTRYSNTSEVVTGFLCAFLCACSWAAMYLFRDSKLS